MNKPGFVVAAMKLKSHVWGSGEWSHGYSSPDVAFWSQVSMGTVEMVQLAVFPMVKLVRGFFLSFPSLLSAWSSSIFSYFSTVDFLPILFHADKREERRRKNLM